MALGYTMALPTEDRYLQSKTEFEDKIAGLLGGNAAERLIFGDTTTGASNDIEKATDLARRMVTEWGMSDKLGPLAFGKRDEMIFLGREIGEQRNYSDDVAKMIDEEVRAIIEHGYARATQTLTEYKAKLLALADKLIAEETVESEEFEKLFDDLPPKLNLHGISGRQPARHRSRLRRRAGRSARREPEPEPKPVLRRGRSEHSNRAAVEPPGSRCARRDDAAAATAGPRPGWLQSTPSSRSGEPDAGRNRHAVSDPALERFLDETADARLESYKALLRIPSISGHSRPRPRLPGRGRVRGRGPAGRRHGARRGLRDGRPPGRVRGLAARRRQARRSWSTATTTSSPSTRSTCGSRRPSCPSSRTARCWPAAPRTASATSACTSGRSRR